MTTAAVHIADVISLPTGARSPWKWVGGKRQLLPVLREHVPVFKRYFEPFAGGAALFFDLARDMGPKKDWAILGDANKSLITAYRCIRDDVSELIMQLRGMERSHLRRKEKFFYELRDDEPTSGMETAARFIALQKLSFNGVYRVNLAGKYNVPYGKWTTIPKVCDESNLRACAKVLRNVRIQHGDFEAIVDGMGLYPRAGKGDFVYFDSPYVPVGGAADFTTYTAGGFGLEDHERLRDVALRLKKRGVHVLLSNADVPLVRKLYRGFSLKKVQARRNVNSKATHRGPVAELLIS